MSNLRASRVFLANELEEILAQYQPDDADARGFARRLVRDRKLSTFQASTLLAGKYKALVLNNYVVQERIGAGGMGQVYKAIHRRMDREVAIKILPPALMRDPDAVNRFHREVKAAAKLTHPNIVTAHDADQTKSIHFLVMEYIRGDDLQKTVAKRGPLPAAKAVDYIVQAARGLSYAHHQGVVHRDIKPANLLIDDQGTVKILDMGLARVEGSDFGTVDAGLTATGVLMGTVDFMSPEQAINTKSADARSDIYSLGCTLYFLLNRRPVYKGDTSMQRLVAHRSSPVPKLTSPRRDVTDELDQIFQKMIAKDVTERFQSMDEVIAALEACQTGLPTDVATDFMSDETMVNEGGAQITKGALGLEAADEMSIVSMDDETRARQTSATIVTALTSRDVKSHDAKFRDGKSHGAESSPTTPKQFAWVWLAGIATAAAILLFVVVVTALFFSTRKTYGTVVLELDGIEARDAQLFVDDQPTATFGPNSTHVPVRIEADGEKHRLSIVCDGAVMYSNVVTVSAGERIPLQIQIASNGAGPPVEKRTQIAQAEHAPINLAAVDPEQVASIASSPAEPVTEANTADDSNEKQPLPASLRNEAEEASGAGESATNLPPATETFPVDFKGRWRPGNALARWSGIAERPAHFDGIASWQVFTREPRAIVTHLSFSPDEKFLACGSTDNIFRIYSFPDFKLVHLFPNQRRFAWSPDGKWIATASADKRLRLWHADSYEPGPDHGPYDRPIVHHQWSRDGSACVFRVGNENGLRMFFDKSNDQVRSLTGLDYPERFVWLPDHRHLLVTERGKNHLVLYDARARIRKRVIETATVPGRLRLSDDGNKLAFEASRSSLGFVGLQLRDQARTVELPPQLVSGFRNHLWRADNNSVYIASRNSTIYVTPDESDKLSPFATSPAGSRNEPEYGMGVFALTRSPRSNLLAAGYWDGSIRVWDSDGNIRSGFSRYPIPSLDHMSMDPDGTTCIATGYASIAHRCDLTGDRPVWKTANISDSNRGQAAWSPDGDQFVLAGSPLQLYHVTPFNENWKNLPGLAKDQTWTHVDWSPTDKYFSVQNNKNMGLLNDQGEKIWSRQFETSGPDTQFDRQGKRVAYKGGSQIQLYDVETRTLQGTISLQKDSIRDFAFSPDGNWLATISWSRALMIWDIPSCKLVSTRTGHDWYGAGVAWSNDSNRLATVAEDRKVVVWNRDRGRGQIVGRHTEYPKWVVWHPKWNGIFTGGNDEAIRLWDTDRKSLVWTNIVMPATEQLGERAETTIEPALSEIKYRYYEGAFKWLPYFEDLIPHTAGSIEGGLITLDLHQRENQFAFIFNASLYAPAEGLYEFAVRADDRARIRIDGERLFRTAGHRRQKWFMSDGRHDLEVEFCEVQGNQRLEIAWRGPGFEWTPLTEIADLESLLQAPTSRGGFTHVTISAAGQVLGSEPGALEKLVYLVELEDGTRLIQTHDEFQALVGE